MTLKGFIQHNKTEINRYILSKCPNVSLNDNERRLWILNDEPLYLWARAEGVKI